MKPQENLDQHLFSEEEGNHYSPSCHMTKDRKLGINVGGLVVVRSLSEWMQRAEFAEIVASSAGIIKQPESATKPITPSKPHCDQCGNTGISLFDGTKCVHSKDEVHKSSWTRENSKKMPPLTMKDGKFEVFKETKMKHTLTEPQRSDFSDGDIGKKAFDLEKNVYNNALVEDEREAFRKKLNLRSGVKSLNDLPTGDNFPDCGISVAQEMDELREIAIYVRDNHLCGTPLQKAINSVVSKNNKKTSITSSPSDKQYWMCVVGPIDKNGLPDGADYPMRIAVTNAFEDLTKTECQNMHSGWGITEGKKDDILREWAKTKNE